MSKPWARVILWSVGKTSLLVTKSSDIRTSNKQAFPFRSKVQPIWKSPFAMRTDYKRSKVHMKSLPDDRAKVINAKIKTVVDHDDCCLVTTRAISTSECFCLLARSKTSLWKGYLCSTWKESRIFLEKIFCCFEVSHLQFVVSCRKGVPFISFRCQFDGRFPVSFHCKMQTLMLQKESKESICSKNTFWRNSTTQPFQSNAVC